MESQDPLEIKILVASDIHLGYSERDNIRQRDSIESFEEVLQIADKNQVDMLLLGGDLFHENKPSRSVIFACTELLRKYCMNDRPVALEFLSDASVNFDHSKFPHVNYLDPNLNIGLPVFSINGNHDDLSGNGLSALDQLHAAGLINYFGKYQNVEELKISPVLLRKKTDAGETKIALYGLGSIRDERLHRLFQDNKVTFLTFDDEKEQKSWFNILVLHQNRVRHGPTNYIPEGVLPSFMDLVIWGHEHPCRIKPEESAVGFKIMQPGSTIATSLAEGEAGEKCVSLLRIKGTTMTDEPIPLKTVRPFYFENIILSDLDIISGRIDTAKKVEEYCDGRVKDYIARSDEEQEENPRKKKPLIRLRIDTSGGFETFNPRHFGNKYIDHVANRDIVLFYKKREQREIGQVDFSVLKEVAKQDAQRVQRRVEDLVKNYFAKVEPANKLMLLTDHAMGIALNELIDKDERDAIDEMVKQQVARVQKKIEDHSAELHQAVDASAMKESIAALLEQIRNMRIRRVDFVDEEEMDGIKVALEASRRRRMQENGALNGDIEEIQDGIKEEVGEDLGIATTPSSSGRRSRGSGRRGRGSRGGGTGRGRGATANGDDTPTTSRGRGRGRGSRGGRGRGAAKRPHEDDDEAEANGNATSPRRSGRNAKRNATTYEEVEIEDGDL